MSVVKEMVDKTGFTREYLLYDAMILACAIRHKADCVIALDGQELKEVADHIGFPVFNPKHYKSPDQGTLPFGSSAPAGDAATKTKTERTKT